MQPGNARHDSEVVGAVGVSVDVGLGVTVAVSVGVSVGSGVSVDGTGVGVAAAPHAARSRPKTRLPVAGASRTIACLRLEEKARTGYGVTMDSFTPPIVPNRWLTEQQQVTDFFPRLEVLSRADAFVVLRGGIGTLTEAALM
jgi:hypothetical protein